MSNSSSAHDALPVDDSSIAALHRGLVKITNPIRFVGFWLAVLLPLFYLPLLAGGLAGNQLTTFSLLVGLNAVSLVVGHDYAR